MLNSDGLPQDLPNLLRDIVAAANARLPFAYRVDRDGTHCALVPTSTRDVLGHVTAITPLMDRRVTIPARTRPIAATAALMADALSAQTGLRVSRCPLLAVERYGFLQTRARADTSLLLCQYCPRLG